MIFKDILAMCVSLYTVLENTSVALIQFFSRTLNDIVGLQSSYAFMNVSLFAVLLGSGLIGFLTYKIIAFIIDILP